MRKHFANMLGARSRGTRAKLSPLRMRFSCGTRAQLSSSRMRLVAASVSCISSIPALSLCLCFLDKVSRLPFWDSRLKSTSSNDATKHTASSVFRGGCKKLSARRTSSSLANSVIRLHSSRCSMSSHVRDPLRWISVVLTQCNNSLGIPIFVSIGPTFTLTRTQSSRGTLFYGRSFGSETPLLLNYCSGFGFAPATKDSNASSESSYGSKPVGKWSVR